MVYTGRHRRRLRAQRRGHRMNTRRPDLRSTPTPTSRSRAHRFRQSRRRSNDRAAYKYFRSSKRPTMDEDIAFYRDSRSLRQLHRRCRDADGRRATSDDEIAEAAADEQRIMISFGSIDPHKGRWRLRGEEAGLGIRLRAYQFHPTVQGFAHRHHGMADLRVIPIQASGGRPSGHSGSARNALRRRAAAPN